MTDIIEYKYIFAVILGSMLVIELFKDYEFVKINKFEIVLVIATIFSGFSLIWNFVVGNIQMESLETFALIKFINFCIAIVFHRSLMKTVPKIFNYTMEKLIK
jgi:hypothetical protein